MSVIEWKKEGYNSIGSVNGLTFFVIRDYEQGRVYMRHCNSDGGRAKTYHATPEEAKAKAEQLFTEWADKANLMVKLEPCPNPYCDNTGIYPTEPDGEPEQCEFCYRNENSVFNYLESVKTKPPEPTKQKDDDFPF